MKPAALPLPPFARLPRQPKAVVFDLDGTLIDSAPDLAASVNIVLGLQLTRLDRFADRLVADCQRRGLAA